MNGPSYMRGRRPVKIPLHSVMEVLQHLGELGHSEQFKKAAQDKGAFVTIHSATVNFVKDYLADNNLHQQSQIARDIVGACPGPDPYECPYAQK